jgi:predicted amidohydrolase YtcJ
VVLKHRSGHVTTVNSSVLERIGVLDGSALVADVGVDRPVAAGALLLGMQSMVQRLSSSGAVIALDERVDATTALRAYTLDAAWIADDLD